MRTILLLHLLLFILPSCGNDAQEKEDQSSEAAASPGGSAECLTGTWTMDDNGVTRSFIFRGDQTGEERYSDDDIRPFTWERSAKKTVHIIYTAHGDVQSAEYDLTIDCETNELSYFGAVYKPG